MSKKLTKGGKVQSKTKEEQADTKYQARMRRASIKDIKLKYKEPQRPWQEHYDGFFFKCDRCGEHEDTAEDTSESEEKKAKNHGEFRSYKKGKTIEETVNSFECNICHEILCRKCFITGHLKNHNDEDEELCGEFKRKLLSKKRKLYNTQVEILDSTDRIRDMIKNLTTLSENIKQELEELERRSKASKIGYAKCFTKNKKSE